MPHVTGVVTATGEELRADLVIDASGRRSSFPAWLTAAGGPTIPEERADAGFVYYCRHFRSGDGSIPSPIGPPLQAYDSISILALPADHGPGALASSAAAATPDAGGARPGGLGPGDPQLPVDGTVAGG